MKTFLFISIFFSPVFLYCSEISIRVAYPSFTGDFYASGRLSFPPAAAPSENNIIVRDRKTGEEVPSKISVIKKWADGSVLTAGVLFPANTRSKGDYSIIYGDSVLRRKNFTEPAVLPTVAFASAGAPRSSENMDMPVGQINVRVDRSSNIYYYWHVLPIALLIAFSIYRTRRAKKARFADED
jgi:hypothetical protein